MGIVEMIKELKEVEKIKKENVELKDFLSNKVCKIKEYLVEIEKILKDIQPDIKSTFSHYTIFSEGTLKSAYGSRKARETAKKVYLDLKANPNIILSVDDIDDKYNTSCKDRQLASKIMVILVNDYKDIKISYLGKARHIQFNIDYKYRDIVITEKIKDKNIGKIDIVDEDKAIKFDKISYMV